MATSGFSVEIGVRNELRRDTARIRVHVFALWIFAAGLISAWTPAWANDPALARQGAALVEARNCLACHRLGAKGGLVGPALDQVTLRRPEAWLRRWLSNPSAVKPGTLMPEYEWSEADFRALFAYLQPFRQPVDGATIIARMGAGARAGKALIEAYQCDACHQVNGSAGRSIYPDLTTVKQRRTPEWERRWLKDPQAVIPGTFMPSFPLSEAEIDAITAFLYPQ